jgi:hypothetical protein
MKPFNLKEALEGKPLVTRGGNDAVGFAKVAGATGDYQYVAAVTGHVETYTKDGVFNLRAPRKPDLDLFMKDEEVWVNIYRKDEALNEKGYYIGKRAFGSEEEARKAPVINLKRYIMAVKVSG